MIKNPLLMQETEKICFYPWGGKIPWRKEEMATHSSILAWRISWTEELGGLQPMGSQKSQMQLSTHAHTIQFTHSRCKIE